MGFREQGFRFEVFNFQGSAKDRVLSAERQVYGTRAASSVGL